MDQLSEAELIDGCTASSAAFNMAAVGHSNDLDHYVLILLIPSTREVALRHENIHYVSLNGLNTTHHATTIS